MARVKNENVELSGRVGNLVYYKRNGKTYVRQYNDLSGVKRSPKQKQCAKAFKASSDVYMFLDKSIKNAWTIAAKSTEITGRSLFLKKNYHAFYSLDGVPDFERLHFSAGKLLLPHNLAIAPREEGGCLSWRYSPKDIFEKSTDKLYIVELYPEDPYRPVLNDTVNACRADQKVHFSTKKDVGKNVHFYCFFGNNDETLFSENEYFCGLPLPK